jgi:ribonuclease D
LREKFAKIYNLPREHLLKNLDLLNIAKFDKNNFNEENLPQYLSNEFKKIIGEEIIKDDISPSIELPIKLDLIDKKNIDKIKSLIAKISKKIQFNEQFLLNNNQIKNIVINNNVKNSINGWRYQIFGNQIEQIIFNQHENNHRKLENEPRL